MVEKLLSTIADIPPLVERLQSAYKRCPILDQIILEAKAGEFHDYKNEKYVCGKHALVDLLQSAGMRSADPEYQMKINDLQQRIIKGEFDEIADEEDKKEMRKDFPREMWKVLGLT